ncbi:hypothetical protein LEP1GSC170_1338 [Leptospira interrogans serovar Bataviae str. HAI135]|nr:hypothetical protein LEP1GSC170_1338 [Leptospira interrogans serovar Bataviae str. HAI135]
MRVDLAKGKVPGRLEVSHCLSTISSLVYIGWILNPSAVSQTNFSQSLRP